MTIFKILIVWIIGLFLGLDRANGQWHEDTGPWVIATKGEPWPLPTNRVLHDIYYGLDTTTFKFEIAQETCDILEGAIHRYRHIIINEARVAEKLHEYRNELNEKEVDLSVSGNINKLNIYLSAACAKYPELSSKEDYSLNVPDSSETGTASLKAESIWGILRGLETFSQLVTSFKNTSGLVIRGQKIVDGPKLPHRGLLLDTSRHYFPLDDILKTLDAMSYNKLNVFHWHIVDDNSFPYVSAAFPELSAKGAYHSSMIYTADDVQKVIEYARLRGIRVIPEFDSPGHTKSWGLAHPEYLTACYNLAGKPNGKLGPINPTNPAVYSFMKSLLGEVSERFPDRYVHLGGDEVPFDCWRTNPDIRHFMKDQNITSNYKKLEEMYIQKILDISAEVKLKPIVWQEVFDNEVQLHNGTAVHVWIEQNWKKELAAVTSAGHYALLSACWYLDHIAGGGNWLKYYNCDPYDFQPTHPDQKKLLLGGEACMWGEYVDRNNVHPRIWPRASAAAERLWSVDKQDDDVAAQRLEEHACRMNRRNISAQPPNGSGFCIA